MVFEPKSTETELKLLQLLDEGGGKFQQMLLMAIVETNSIFFFFLFNKIVQHRINTN